MINAFSQLGNIAGSYVWNLTQNGYRNSYGIVTAMFGITIIGCLAFRQILVGLNKKLDEVEAATDAQVEEEKKSTAVHLDHEDEALRMRKGFRYLI